jgi:hypothetical protein
VHIPLQQYQESRTTKEDRRQGQYNLHNDLQVSISMQASAAMACNRTHGDFSNYGEYLYIEGLSELEKRRQRNLMLVREREIAEMAGLTFKPQISENSRRMRPPMRAPAWQRLSAQQPKRRVEHKLAIHEGNAQEALLAECTFHPKVCAPVV